MSRSLVVLGDHIAGGFGDARHLGWVGRVLARSVVPSPDHVAVLPVPFETSTQLAKRWRAECSLRFAGVDQRLVVLAPGHSDISGSLSLARSRLNLANAADQARSEGVSVFIVGPTPRLEDGAGAVGKLDAAFREVAERRGVPYAALYPSLVAHEGYLSDLGATDGATPSQVGYGLIAYLVLRHGWHDWYGSAEA